MKRPLIPVLIGFIAGLLVEARWPVVTPSHPVAPLPNVPLLIICAYLGLLGLWGLAHAFNHGRLATTILVLLTVLIGMTRYALHTALPVNHIARFVTDERVTIEGFIYKPVEFSAVNAVEHRPPNRYLYVRTTALEQGATRYQVCGDVRITIFGSSLLQAAQKTFMYGDQIRIRLRLRVPTNFDDFDYQEYLQRQGIYLVGAIGHDRYIIQLPERQRHWLLTPINALRNRILAFFEAYAAAHPKIATEPLLVLKAMTLGMSRELSAALKINFRNSGIYHLLVVSGIHVGLLATVVHVMLHGLRVPRSYRSLVVIPVIFYYAGLSGFHYPVLRAALMAVVFYFGITCNRVAESFYSLLFASGVLLFISPTGLFDVSFQLTVMATAAILVLFACVRQLSWWPRLMRTPAYIRHPALTFLMTLGANIGVAPLLAFYFGELSPYTFLSNLAAIIVVSLLLPGGFAVEALALILPWKVVNPLCTLILSLSRGFIMLSKVFPPHGIRLAPPSLLFLMGYYLAVFGGGFLWLHIKRRPHHARS